MSSRTRRWVAVLLVGAAVAVAAFSGIPRIAAARRAASAQRHIAAARLAHYPPRPPSGGARPDHARAVEEYQQAIRLVPNRREWHLGLIQAARALAFQRSPLERPARAGGRVYDDLGREELEVFYAGLERRFPKEPTIHWALGRVLVNDRSRAAAQFRQAVADDPGFAPAYAALGAQLLLVDDRAGARRLFQEAAAADPSDAEYAERAATLIPADDPATFAREMQQVLASFPRSQYAAFVLGAAAARAQAPDDRIRILERQHRDYPDAGRALTLFQAYLDAGATAKAMALAASVLDRANERWVPAMWKPYISCGEALTGAQSLADAGKFGDARALLDRATVTWPCWMTSLHALRARIDVKDGQVAGAVDRLIDVVAIERTAALQSLLYEYGAMAGRTTAAIEEEIWRRRGRSAAALEDFTLARIDGAGVVRLADFRGQVVLVNFWYPG